MSAVTATITISAPPAVVWATMLDGQRTRDWVTIVRSVDHVDDGELTPGFSMKQTLALRGVPFSVTWRLDKVEVPTFARWVGAGPARSEAIIEYRLTETAPGTTEVEYLNEFRTPFGPLGALASRTIVGDVPQDEAESSLRRLKALIESHG